MRLEAEKIIIIGFSTLLAVAVIKSLKDSLDLKRKINEGLEEESEKAGLKK